MPTKTSGTVIKTQERRALVLKLRKAGLTLRNIVKGVYQQFNIEELPKNYDSLQCSQDIIRELAKIQKENRETITDIRNIEIQRLDEMLLGLWQKATVGNKEAIDKVLKIMDRRAKYLGLDAPTKVAPTDPSGKKEYNELSNEELTKRVLAIVNGKAASGLGEISQN